MIGFTMLDPVPTGGRRLGSLVLGQGNLRTAGLQAGPE